MKDHDQEDEQQQAALEQAALKRHLTRTEEVRTDCKSFFRTEAEPEEPSRNPKALSDSHGKKQRRSITAKAESVEG